MSYGIVILRGARRDEQLILIKEYGEPVAFATLLEANTAAARLCGGIDVDAVPVPLPDETLSQPDLLFEDPMVRARRARAEVKAIADRTMAIGCCSLALRASMPDRTSYGRSLLSRARDMEFEPE
jgi:hypothetical protein